jgi:hypothetical protein
VSLLIPQRVLRLLPTFLFISRQPLDFLQRAAFLAATRGLRPSHMTTDSRTPPDLAYLREKCWHGDPMERPTFHDVLSKLGEMMFAVSGGKSGVHELPPLPDNSSEGQYSDQFSTAPIETLTHLWDRRCRQLSRLLLQKPKVEQLVQRRVRYSFSFLSNLVFTYRSCSRIRTLILFQESLRCRPLLP